MKDRSHDLRRIGRGRHSARVYRGNQARLSEMSSTEERTVSRRESSRPHPKQAARKSHGGALKWRVRIEHGRVIAIEPGDRHEHVFAGYADDFEEALKFAAAQLRKELVGD